MRRAPFVSALLPCVFLGLATTLSAKQVRIGQGSVVATVLDLKAGDFIWEPRLSPRGPLVLVVNSTTQRALLYRNGIPIAATTVSTGRPGYRTPTGIFTILQKRVEHYSSKYDNAPMPYMQRLTWGGIALHAGNLPGYPASHGCIRLPLEFARKLYATTQVGMTVLIIDRPASPRVAPSLSPVPGPGDAIEGSGDFDWHPERAPTGPLSILVGARDGRALVLRNGVIIGSSKVAIAEPVRGTIAYVLGDGAPGSRHWTRIDFTGEKDGSPVEPQEWKRFSAPSGFASRIGAILQPGTTIVVTADSLEPSATSDAGVILEGDLR